MLPHHACPACATDSWTEIGQQEFSSEPAASTYVKQRLDVLFSLWARDVDRLTVSWQRCDACGFVDYSPRPTSQQVQAKSARLGGATSTTVESPGVTRIDRVRSDELWHAVAPERNEVRRVLDYGGGTGSLMNRFIREGCEVCVIDYAPEVVHGVQLLGQTVDDLDDDARFDLIIASHVVEHMAEPVEVLTALRAHLSARGRIYVEVPMELQGGPPDVREPVTHLNFFTEVSLTALLERAGFAAQQCVVQPTTHASGRYALAVRALARATERPRATRDDRRPHVALTEGGRLQAFALRLRHPQLLLNPVRRRWLAAAR